MNIMFDFDNPGKTLKVLDKLDEIHYTPRCNVSSSSVKSMAETQDPDADSNLSDFDNSDEDLASLLGDDDDEDIFAKKIFGNSPKKTPTSDAQLSVIKSKPDTKASSPSHTFKNTPKAVTESSAAKTSSKDDYSDILDDFLESSKSTTADLETSSPEKNKKKQSSFQNEEVSDDLNINDFSPLKDKSLNNPVKKTKSIDKQLDISDGLNTPEKIKSKVSEGRRGSFFDDFLQNLSPVHKAKKTISPAISEENIKDNKEIDEDILGAYIPTPPKKIENISDSVSKSPKRQTKLLKQVSFKNLSDDFSKTDVAASKATASPVKDTSFKPSLPESKRSESNMRQTKQIEKGDSSKKEDIDWLNFFKDSPKKTPKIAETKRKDSVALEKTNLPVPNKSKPAMRRQSSADWLGLSDSNVLDDEDDNSIGDSKLDKMPVTNIKLDRAKTAPAIRPRRQDQNKRLSEWNDDDEEDFIKDTSQPVTADLTQILKSTDPQIPSKKSAVAAPYLKESSEIIKKNSFASPKVKKDIHQALRQQTPNNESLPDTFVPNNAMIAKEFISKVPFDVVHESKPHQNFEQTAALHSMQVMLDDSIKERNKLIKENENTKAALEEKLKILEEFYKSEKKMLEDSFKSMESSLKKEFEAKMKSLDERLNLITEEKEKQAKSFDEKFHNILKEHQLEIQRLKDLHSQSINIMKKDHEDALSRLKRLKEQEVEAVLSTQMHSKSLQHISDQLEARASELATLQNKVEERNMVTIREKQAFLDAKEKNLKALENRLQKQLEDNEDERTRLQQLVLRLESRLQKLTMESEEEHWDAKQMKAKLTIQMRYLEEEQKLNQYQLEKEKEKLRLSQDSLLQEQKSVLLQLAHERQQLTQEKIDIQSLTKSIKEEEAKLSIKKLKEESSIATEKQFLLEEKNELHFEKERMKEESYQFEREHDSLQREKQQLKREKEKLKELEIQLKRKSTEIEEMAATVAQEKEKGQREYSEALAIKKEHQQKMHQYTHQMQMLMDKERHILSEREKFMAEKMELEQNRSSVLCTKCKLSQENPIQVSRPELSMPVVFSLPNNINGLSNQVQHSFVDPNLVIWQIAAQKDREFLQEELAYLKSLKDSSKRKNSK